jgi:hypothetical protein
MLAIDETSCRRGHNYLTSQLQNVDGSMGLEGRKGGIGA